ncbi:MAG: hypothetical protein WDZ59_17470 [Pirellulales bacterium]
MKISDEAQQFFDGVRGRVAKYYGHEFTYQVKVILGPKPERSPEGKRVPGHGPSTTISAVDTLSLMPPAEKGGRPWHSWIRRERDRITNFVCFDGSVTRFYERSADAGKYSIGAIYPWEEYLDWDDMDIFGRLVSNDLTIYCEYENPSWTKFEGFPRKWEVVEKRQYLGYPAHVLRGTYRDKERIVVVLDAPSYLVVSSEFWSRRQGDEKPDLAESLEITQLEELDGFVYPAAGRFEEGKSSTAQDMEYSFTVTDVKSLDESAREEWFPPWPVWPLGISVQDRVTGKNFYLPSERDLQPRLRRGSLPRAQ